jgi:hypothetical protein
LRPYATSIRRAATVCRYTAPANHVSGDRQRSRAFEKGVGALMWVAMARRVADQEKGRWATFDVGMTTQYITR